VIYTVQCDIQGTLMVDVAANCREVIERIGEAASHSGRNPTDIRLLAASKSQTVDKIQAAIEAGVRLFGENYVQEAEAKRSAVGGSVEWHMIGHLQRNKARTALDLFDLIQSLDNVELAQALDKEGKKKKRVVRAFVEVNLAAEESKSGVACNRVAGLLEEIGKLPNIRIEGLRTLNAPNVDLRELSMGMTHDYPVAIEEGATLVRVGTAIFGPRSG
jgi:pyridoxal phosphate enzyme (YggS family)